MLVVMAELPEAGRLSAHVILDAVTAYDFSSSGDSNVAAMSLALDRINDVDGAATLHVDESGRPTSLDVSALVGAAAVTISWLVHQLAEAGGVDPHDVITQVREFIDE